MTIVDRKKELIINAAGKNMSPANIEAALKGSSPLIGQACVIGDARPYNVALIVLDPDFAPVRRAPGPTRATGSSPASACAAVQEASTPPTRRSRGPSRSSASRSSTATGCPAATS